MEEALVYIPPPPSELTSTGGKPGAKATAKPPPKPAKGAAPEEALPSKEPQVRGVSTVGGCGAFALDCVEKG